MIHRLLAGLLLIALLLPPARGADTDAAPAPFHGTARTETPAAEPAPEPETRALPLVHADAASVAKLLEEDGAGVLSEAGRASVDERTNTLVLRDTPERLAAAKALVEELDHATRQVMIEARIVLASGEYSRELGSRLGLSSVRGDGSVAFESFSSGEVGGNDGLLAELPEVDTGGRLSVSVGEVGERLLQLELSAMEAEGHGRVVSTPRVLTSERQEARIEQGVQIPYQETAESGGTAVSFQDAALSLTATPQVGEDDTVTLDLRVTKDAIGQIFQGVPSIDTQSVATRLRVDAGETIVLGGVREQKQRAQERRVPWLAEIPLVGWLFRQRTERRNHQELLVFVTPRLVQEDGSPPLTSPDNAPE